MRARLLLRHLGTALAAACAFAVPASGGDVPPILSYQGVLTLADGTAIDDGSYVLELSVVDGQDVVQHQEQLTVSLQDSLYSVLLGGQAGSSLADAFDDAPRFLDVTILSGPEPGIAGTAMPRQTMAPVPFALRAALADEPTESSQGVPTGALVLWDQATGCGGVTRECPCGWSEAGEFQGLMVRGADLAMRWDDLPDIAGTSSGSPSAVGMYGDFLSANEMPSHDHEATGIGDHSHSYPNYDGYSPGQGNAYVNSTTEADSYGSAGWSVTLDAAGNHGHTTAGVGNGDPHRHPSVRVLFCRKD